MRCFLALLTVAFVICAAQALKCRIGTGTNVTSSWTDDKECPGDNQRCYTHECTAADTKIKTETKQCAAEDQCATFKKTCTDESGTGASCTECNSNMCNGGNMMVLPLMPIGIALIVAAIWK